MVHVDPRLRKCVNAALAFKHGRKTSCKAFGNDECCMRIYTDVHIGSYCDCPDGFRPDPESPKKRRQ
ncbi:hypothetical protein B9Z55_027673 [Caenorhabditis nigoni]|uniref:EGF-like domain-containing protein n=1 Tax=Caenorhabditis nigoni TaxID=1611254 RepID=A0A2G5SET6_9PELO|nr:hypothetical protein B9Z55_027673 [Caenorhabditis nigoni]